MGVSDFFQQALSSFPLLELTLSPGEVCGEGQAASVSLVASRLSS